MLNDRASTGSGLLKACGAALRAEFDRCLTDAHELMSHPSRDDRLKAVTILNEPKSRKPEMLPHTDAEALFIDRPAFRRPVRTGVRSSEQQAVRRGHCQSLAASFPEIRAPILTISSATHLATENIIQSSPMSHVKAVVKEINDNGVARGRDLHSH